MYQFVDSLNKLSSLLGDGDSASADMFPLEIRKKELNIAEWQLAQDAKDLAGYQSGYLTSTNVLTLPTDWIENHLLIVNNRMVSNNREIALADYERYYNYTGDNPYFYYWVDGAGEHNINFFGSVTDAPYRLYYFKKPTSELSADDDISLHPEQFRMATAYHAASELMRQIGRNSIANDYRAIYEAMAMKAFDWARKHYITKEYARPDFGESDATTVDTQGQGYQ